MSETLRGNISVLTRPGPADVGTVRIDRGVNVIPATVSILQRNTESSSPKQDQILSPGDRFGHYIVDQELGRGGFGQVVQAHTIENGTQVAIKVPTEDGIEGFSEEVEATKRFSDAPHVREYVGTGTIETENGNVPFMAMELVDRALQDKLADGPLALIEAGALTAQVTDALKTMHEKGYIHNDIKAANILLAQQDGKEDVRVSDLGLADESPMYQNNAIIGTISALPPEAFYGYRVRKSDSHSVGVLFYTLITGEELFNKKFEKNDVRLPGYKEEYGEHIDAKLAILPEKLRQPLQEVLDWDPEKRTTPWDFSDKINAAINTLTSGLENVSGAKLGDIVTEKNQVAEVATGQIQATYVEPAVVFSAIDVAKS